MMTKSQALLSFIVVATLCSCVELSPAGAQVKIINEDQRTLVSACKYLGSVSVSSEDALRNNTAALSGDTAIMRYRDIGATTTIVTGDVFRCTGEMNQRQREDTTDTESLRKSTLCQSKGGSWASGQCIIPIE